MKNMPLLAALALALAAFALSSCTKDEEPPGPELSAGALQISDNYGTAFWLNDEEAVFYAVDRRDPAIGDSYAFGWGKSHIYTWKHGKFARYSGENWPDNETGRDNTYLCAEGGQIYYTQQPLQIDRESGVRSGFVMKGKPGQERKVLFAHHFEGMTWSDRININPISLRCDQQEVPELDGHLWLPSYDRSVVLDFGAYPRDAKGLNTKVGPLGNPISIYSQSDRSRIQVKNVPGDKADFTCSYPLSWEKAFVASECLYTDNSPSPAVVSLWKIKFDGSSVQADIKTGRRPHLRFWPFRNGYFAKHESEADTKDQRQAESGLYVAIHGELKQLVPGYIRPLALSPNGCLLFMSEWTDFKYGYPLANPRIVDLCAASK